MPEDLEMSNCEEQSERITVENRNEAAFHVVSHVTMGVASRKRKLIDVSASERRSVDVPDVDVDPTPTPSVGRRGSDADDLDEVTFLFLRGFCRGVSRHSSRNRQERVLRNSAFHVRVCVSRMRFVTINKLTQSRVNPF